MALGSPFDTYGRQTTTDSPLATDTALPSVTNPVPSVKPGATALTAFQQRPAAVTTTKRPFKYDFRPKPTKKTPRYWRGTTTADTTTDREPTDRPKTPWYSREITSWGRGRLK